MIGDLLPSGVAVAETREPGETAALMPVERAQMDGAAVRRLAEFAAGRTCARRALAAIGAPHGPVLMGPDRQPLWPAGVIGSITHCAGYCAAATAWRGALAAVGIDAEPHDVLPPDVLGRVALPSEVRFVQAHRAGHVCWDRVLFSAKESVFKAWYPLTGLWLGFHEAWVVFRPREGRFDATLLVPGPRIDGVLIQHFAGRFVVRDDLVVTAVAVPSPGRPGDDPQRPSHTFLGRRNSSNPARPPARP